MKNTDWLYKLPRNSSRAAGNALKILCELSKPADEPDSLSAFLGKIVRINQRTTEGWLDGQLNHKRGRFTKEHFRVITTYFARESKVLTCGDEINAFARLFGEDFVLELSKDWAIELQLGYKRSRELPDKSDSRYPQISSPIERNFLTLIINKIEVTAQPMLKVINERC